MAFHSKPAIAGIATILPVLIVIGVFKVSENALPGDFLYPAKKVAENINTRFSSKKNEPVRQLELVNSRLEDLTKVAQRRQGKDLPLAYKEVQESASQAAQKLVAEIKKPEKDSDISKKIIVKAQEFKKKKKIAEKTTLADMTGTEELNKVIDIYFGYKTLAEREINFWMSRSLNKEKQKALKEAEQLYKKGDYLQAVELLHNSQK